MKNTCPESTIEIWSDEYINYPDRRRPEDQRAHIIQIEPGMNANNYMVEVIRDAE